MHRILAAFAAFNTVALLAALVFIVHGSVRDGCAQASAAASQAWLAVALADSGDRRIEVSAAADTALAFAASEVGLGARRADQLPWGSDAGALVTAMRAVESDEPVRIELARLASRRALAVCGS